MIGGLCKVHGTELNGFGSLVFCNACDAENSIQEAYEADKESAMADNIYMNTKDVVEVSIPPARGLKVIGDYFGWVIKDKRTTGGLVGDIVLPIGETVFVNQPAYNKNLNKFIYQVNIKGVEVSPGYDSLTVTKGAVVRGKQLQYKQARRYLGGVIAPTKRH